TPPARPSLPTRRSSDLANALSHAVERGPAPPIGIALGAVRHGCEKSPHLFRVGFHADHRADLMKEIATSLRLAVGKARNRQLEVRQRTTRRCGKCSHLHPRVFHAVCEKLVL